MARTFPFKVHAMKNTLLHVLVPLLLASLAPLLLAGGCDGDSNVGYHYVSMSWLPLRDQVRLLNDKDHDKVYNALCDLYSSADFFDEYFSNDSLRHTPQYDTIVALHARAFNLMGSSDPWVSSAAIRFIGKFKYHKKEFIDVILRNNTRERNIQLEICEQLRYDSTKDQNLLREKVLFLRKQRDWLLRNSAYAIINPKDSCPADLFMEDFRGPASPEVRMFALDAMQDHVSDTVFHFLIHAWELENDPTMKHEIQRTLYNAKNPNLLAEWLETQPAVVQQLMPTLVALSGDEPSTAVSSIIVRQIRKGWKPSAAPLPPKERNYPGEPILYRNLLRWKFHSTERPDSNTLTADMRAIENALLSDSLLAQEWLSYQEKMSTRPLPSSFLRDHRALTDEYLRKSLKMMEGQVTDTAAANAFQRSIRSDSWSLYRTRLTNRKGE
jgi:hypothetical protein